MSKEAEIDKLLQRLRALDNLSPTEAQALHAAADAMLTYGPEETIIHEGQPLNVSILLISGLMCRYKDLQSGSRQISAVHVPGDFVDLHGFTLKRLDHDILTLSRCRAVTFPHDRLRQITEEHPHLTRMLWLLTNIDAAIHREWELSLGRRTALARVAHFFCELLVRLEVVGLAQDDGYELGLTQFRIAECLGLTNVHVNRTLRELREQGLVEYRRGRVRVYDRKGLARVAEFNPSYLYLNREAH